MNKKISLGVAFALMFIVATVTFTTTVMYTRNKFNQTVSNITQREAMYDKLAEIDTYVRNNYIGSIDEDLLMDSIASGYLSGIEDRYGSYYTVEQYEQITANTEGKINSQKNITKCTLKNHPKHSVTRKKQKTPEIQNGKNR